MRIIAAINSKGGTGKSSIVRALAVRAAQDWPAERDGPPRVAVVDLDPQQTVAEWWHRRGEDPNIRLLRGVTTAREASDWLEHNGAGLEVVFIDTPPGHLHELADVAAMADVAIIPVRPDYDNLLASRDALAITQMTGRPTLALLTQCPPTSTAFEDTARAGLEDAGVTVAAKVTKHRVAWSRALDVGKSPAEIDKKVADEINAIWDEINASGQEVSDGGKA